MPGFCYPGTATGTGTDTRVFFYCSLSFVNRIRRGAVTRGADAEPREQSHGHGEGLRVARWGPGSHDGLPIGRNEKRERRQRREERKPGGDGLSSCRQEPETTSTRPPSSEAPLTADVRSLNSHEVPVVEMQPNSLKPDGIDPTRHQELAATEKTAEQDDRDGLVCREALDSCESSQDSQGRGPSTAAAQRSLEGPHQPNSNEPRPTTELYDPAIGQDHRATLSSSKILPAGKLLPVSLWTDTAAEGAATLLPFQATSVAVLPSDSHEPEPLAEVFEPQARQDHAAELRPVDPGALAQEDFVSTPTSPEVLVAGLLAGSHRPEPIVLPELLKPPTEQMVGDSLVSQEAQAAAMRQASQEPEPGAQDPTVMAATFHRVLDGVGVAARGPVPYMPEHTVVTRGQKTKQEVAASMSPNERPVAGMPQDLHESGPQPAAQKVAITTPSPPESLVGGSSSYDSTETSEEVVQRSLISAEILSNGIPSRTAMKSLSSAGVLSTHSTELKSSHELHDNRGVEQGVGLSLNRSVEVNSGRMPQGLAELKSPTDLCAKSAEQDVWESLKYPLVLPDWMPLDSAQPGPKMALHTEAAMQDAGESLALQEVVDGRWSDLCLPEANFHTLLYLLCAAGAIHAIQAERCASCIYAGKRGVRFKDCLTAIRAIADEYLVRLSQFDDASENHVRQVSSTLGTVRESVNLVLSSHEQALKYFCKVIDGMIKELSKQVEAFGNSSYGSQVEALTVLLCLKESVSVQRSMICGHLASRQPLTQRSHAGLLENLMSIEALSGMFAEKASEDLRPSFQQMWHDLRPRFFYLFLLSPLHKVSAVPPLCRAFKSLLPSKQQAALPRELACFEEKLAVSKTAAQRMLDSLSPGEWFDVLSLRMDSLDRVVGAMQEGMFNRAAERYRGGLFNLCRAQHETSLLKQVQSEMSLGKLGNFKDEKMRVHPSSIHVCTNACNPESCTGRVEMREMIASGTEGCVYIGTMMGSQVAVKVFHLGESDLYESQTCHRRNAVKEYVREVCMCSSLNHPNICRFVGASVQLPWYCIAMEYVSGGSLWDALRAGKRGRVSFMGAALHVASAMEHMHVELGVLHRDLKSPNLLVSTDGVVKLSDFGLVCKESSENKAPEVGTFRWMAPEVVLFRPYGFPADVYSYGTVLWELLTSNIPFDGEQLFDGNAAQQRQGARKCAQENIRPKIPHGTPPRVRELILRCWHPLPEKRPDFGMITKELRAIDEELLPDERAFLAGDHLEGGVEAYAM